MAFSVHIPPLLAQCALNAHSHSTTEFLETTDTVILLVNLDVSNHRCQSVSIAGDHNP
jgi:hypothetical protein